MLCLRAFRKRRNCDYYNAGFLIEPGIFFWNSLDNFIVAVIIDSKLFLTQKKNIIQNLFYHGFHGLHGLTNIAANGLNCGITRI
jgi:hypothetical protein